MVKRLPHHGVEDRIIKTYLDPQMKIELVKRMHKVTITQRMALKNGSAFDLWATNGRKYVIESCKESVSCDETGYDDERKILFPCTQTEPSPPNRYHR